MDHPEANFEKIENNADKEKYWQAVVESKISLLAQLSNGQTVTLIPDTRRLSQLFVKCSETHLPDKDQNTFISFQAHSEQLFLRTQLSKTPEGQYFIDLFPDLFRLQRRANFRIVIPSLDPLAIFLNQLGANNIKIKTRAVDISLGGVLIEWPDEAPEIHPGEFIAGIIVTDKAIGIQFSGQIRHIKPAKDKQKRQTGVCFEKLMGNGLSELNNLIMRYYRKIFSKFSNL